MVEQRWCVFPFARSLMSLDHCACYTVNEVLYDDLDTAQHRDIICHAHVIHTPTFQVDIDITTRPKDQKRHEEYTLEMAGACMENSIDDGIDVHHNNTPSPVDKLPSELLCAIFWLVTMDARGLEYNPAVFTPEWIVFSHVCQRWWSIAMADPNLWTQIPTFNISEFLLSKMLERSFPADLSVKISYTHENDWHKRWTESHLRKVKQIFGEHGDRIAHLWLDTTGVEAYAQSLMTVLPTLAPRLKTLHLIGTTSEYWVLTSVIGSLPPHRLLGTHNLRELHLSHFGIEWDHSPLLTNLTHLKLCNIRPVNKPTPTQLYNVLNILTNLIDLHLDNALPPIDDDDGAAYFPRIHLPQLIMLVVKSANPNEVQAFFRSVTITPTSTSVNVTTTNVWVPLTHDFERLISAVTDCYSPPIYDAKFRSFHLERCNLDFSPFILVRLGAKDPIVERDYSLHNAPPHLSLLYVHTSFSSENLDGKFILSSFWNSRTFDLRQVTHVYLHYPQIASNVLYNSVGTSPEVSSITISEHARRSSEEREDTSCGTSGGFLQALSNDGASSPFLPGLTTINFDRVRFRSIKHPSLTWYDVDVKKLRECLVRRAAYAPAITRVIMRYCIGAVEADVAFLREKIESVELGGRDVFVLNNMLTSFDCHDEADRYSDASSESDIFDETDTFSD